VLLLDDDRYENRMNVRGWLTLAEINCGTRFPLKRCFYGNRFSALPFILVAKHLCHFSSGGLKKIPRAA
jgi:hypothetical protein